MAGKIGVGCGVAAQEALSDGGEDQAVDVGRRNDHEAEIVKGLTENDRVIIHPGNAVSDDTRIVERK